MQHNITGVFIIKSNEYVEITYQEFINRYHSDTAYEKKYFICVHDKLLEVSKEDYDKHYKVRGRNRYLKKLDIIHGLISMEDIDNSEAVAYAESQDIAVTIEEKLMQDKLAKCLSELADDEKELIEALFFQNMTEREYASKKGIYHNAIHKKKVRILKKLKNLLEK